MFDLELAIEDPGHSHDALGEVISIVEVDPEDLAVGELMVARESRQLP